MPKIQFSNLPRAVWHHLLEHVEQRRVSLADLLALQDWVKTKPVEPDGDWYKDLGSLIFCGSGQFPKTVLGKGMKPFGEPIL